MRARKVVCSSAALKWPVKSILRWHFRGILFYIISVISWQVHANKSSFCALETEYLGFILTPDGIRPQPKEVQAILNMAPPKNVLHVRSFLGAINHYKKMIPQRSQLSTPLTNLTHKDVKFQWTADCQNPLKLWNGSWPNKYPLHTLTSAFHLKSTLMLWKCNLALLFVKASTVGFLFP